MGAELRSATVSSLAAMSDCMAGREPGRGADYCNGLSGHSGRGDKEKLRSRLSSVLAPQRSGCVTLSKPLSLSVFHSAFARNDIKNETGPTVAWAYRKHLEPCLA